MTTPEDTRAQDGGSLTSGIYLYSKNEASLITVCLLIQSLKVLWLPQKYLSDKVRNSPNSLLHLEHLLDIY